MEIRKNRREAHFFSLAAALLSAAVSAMLLIHSDAAAEAVRRGIDICGASVIPSLFPMMFMSQYIVKSGAAELAGSLLEKPVRVLFGLSGICGVALLTSLIGGYPAGARAAETLVTDGLISRREGKRLANMAFCAGPGFAIGMIGGELYKNKSIGLLILTAQALSCIIIGIASRLLPGNDGAPMTERRDNPPAVSSRTDAFVQSAAGTASTMLHMCSFIILFQVILCLLELSGFNSALGRMTEALGLGSIGRLLLPCTLEVTGGSILSVKAGVPFTAFVVGFGGLSVHFQNFSICRSVRPSKPLFLLTRTLQGALCSMTVSLALRLPWFSPAVIPTSGNVTDGIPVSFSRVSVGFGCTMLVMCLMSVICLPSDKESSTI